MLNAGKQSIFAYFNWKLLGFSLAILFSLSIVAISNLPVAEASLATCNPSSEGNFKTWILKAPSGTTKPQAVNSDDGDTSTIYRDANSKRQTFGLTCTGEFATSAVTSTTKINKVTWYAKSKAVGSNPIQLSVEKGTTAKNISDGPFVNPTVGSYGLNSREMLTDPFGGSWTKTKILAYKFGVNNQQQQNIRVDVTKLYLVVDYVSPTPPTISPPIQNPTTPDCVTDTNQITWCNSSNLTVNGITLTWTAYNPDGTQIPANKTQVCSATTNTCFTDDCDAFLYSNDVPPGGDALYCKATTSDGITGSSATQTLYLDQTPPTTTISGATSTNGFYETNGIKWTKDKSITVSFSVTDSSSGYDKSTCQIDAQTPVNCTAPSYTTPEVSDGSHTLTIKSTDKAGNQENTATFSWTVDTTSPVITITPFNQQTTPVRFQITPDNANDQYSDPGSSATDGVGVGVDPANTSTVGVNDVNSDVVGVYPITYNYGDYLDNLSSATRDVAPFDFTHNVFPNDVTGIRFFTVAPDNPIQLTIQDQYALDNNLPVVVSAESFDNNSPPLSLGTRLFTLANSGGSYFIGEVDLALDGPSTSVGLPVIDGGSVIFSYLGYSPPTVVINQGAAGGAVGTATTSSLPIRWQYDAYTLGSSGLIKGATGTTLAGGTTPITATVQSFSSSDATGTAIGTINVSLTRSATSSEWSSGSVTFSGTTNDSTDNISVPAGGTIKVSYLTNSQYTTIYNNANLAVVDATAYTQSASTPKFTAACTDADQDALCDSWETSTGLNVSSVVNGVTYSYSYPCVAGNTYATDPTGATVCPNPTIPDIYAEVDYMVGHKPSAAAISKVTQAFRDSKQYSSTNSKLANDGIHVHFVLDDALPHLDNLPKGTSTTSNTFFNWKTTYFGECTVRGGTCSGTVYPTNTNALVAKSNVFHYGMFIHNIATTDLSSGWADLGGNDFVCSLGSFGGRVGTVNQQASCLMHELTHNLYIDHGGIAGIAGQSAVNCKPNMPGIMNYAYQYPAGEGGFIPLSKWKLDLVGGVYNNINENSLVDGPLNPGGVASATSPQRTIVWGSASTTDTTTYQAESNTNINWDQPAITGSPYSRLVHHFYNFPGCYGTVSGVNYATKTTLNSYKDWAAITLSSYTMKNFAGFANGLISISHIDSVADVPIGEGAPETANPLVDAGLDQTIQIPQLYSLNATIEDYDSNTLTITIDWGDGTVPEVIPITFDPQNPITSVDLPDHSYSLPGIFTVTVTAQTTRNGFLSDESGHLTPNVFSYQSSDTAQVTVLAPDVLVDISSPNPTGYNQKRTLPVNVIVSDPITNITVLGATVEIFMPPTGTFDLGNLDNAVLDGYEVVCRGTNDNLAEYVSSIDKYQCHVELENYTLNQSYDVIARVGDSTDSVTITIE